MGLLRDRSREFDEADVALYGISRDSPYTHVAWSAALDLTFPLLSDWNGDAVTGFGIEQTYRGLHGVARRSAFLVERGGTVRGAWSYDTDEVPDLDELLASARSL
jgi:peroxiredoxin